MKVEKAKAKVEGEERTAKKPKMTAEQKQVLDAMRSYDEDVKRAEYISDIADCVLRDMCTKCDHRERCADDRKKIGCLATLNCRMSAIASVAVGIIKEGGAK